jgi:hypothetical protein
MEAVKRLTLRKSVAERDNARVEIENWRRGWDTHPGTFRIPSCFQQHALKPHGYLRFL